MFGKRILVLVPHPDDEVVACSAAIGRAQAQGSEVFVLYLTHGCIPREMCWPWHRLRYQKIVDRRYEEGKKAAAFLGIPAPGRTLRPARFVWRQIESVFLEVTQALATHRIDQIWVPAYEGGNADHDAANAIGHILKATVSVLEFAEYNFNEGRVHSQEFPRSNGSEEIILLTPEEQQRKRNALSLYSSERGNLNYVRVERECYRPLALYDYSKPPHPGTLWYARFQWVPFRHPRVDFTNPHDVCTAISVFLNR